MKKLIVTSPRYISPAVAYSETEGANQSNRVFIVDSLHFLVADSPKRFLIPVTRISSVSPPDLAFFMWHDKIKKKNSCHIALCTMIVHSILEIGLNCMYMSATV